MTNPTYPGTRPTTVTVSTYLLWATAAISVISGILTLSQVGAMNDVYSELFAGSPTEGAESSLAVGSTVFGVVLNILFAAGLVILAIFNNRGRNGARITTWVLGGLMLCCSGFGLLGTAFQGQLTQFESANTGGPTTAEITEALDRAMPSWFNTVSTLLTVLSLLSILGAVILLALPASNRFFRRPAMGFDPSVPYPAYPTGQPPYPQGQPPYPAAPQQPWPGHPAPPPGQPPAQPSAPPQQQHPGTQPPAQPPAQPPPSSDPWSRPDGDDQQQRPPSDPTSQP